MKVGATKAALSGLIGACLLTTILSCTPRPPEILRAESELRLVTDRRTDESYEQLSLFVEAEDPDGFEDLDEIVLLQDSAELYWRIDKGSWVVTRGGQWIGTAGLTMPLLTPFPRGAYRLVLYDAGGNSQETTLTLEAPTRAAPLPDVSVEAFGIELRSPESVVVQVVDPQGRTVTQKRVFAGRHNWESITEGAEVPLDARIFAYVDAVTEARSGRLPRLVGPFFR